MRRRAAFGPLLLLGLLLWVPAAEAARVPSFDFHGTLDVPVLGATNETSNKTRIALFSGLGSVQGNGTGLIAVANATFGLISHTDRVEVYDRANQSNVDPDEYRKTGRPIAAAYENATVTLSPQATFFYYTHRAIHQIAASSSYALGLVVDPSKALSNQQIQLTLGPSLALIGTTAVVATTTVADQDSFLYTVAGVNVTISSPSDQRNGTYEGSQYLYRFVGTTVLAGEGDTVLLPIGDALTARFSPTRAQALGQFDLTRLNRAFDAIFPNGTYKLPFSLDPRANSVFQSVASLFNGALIGNPQGAAQVGGQNRTLGPLTLYRFEEVTLSRHANASKVQYQGHGSFLLAGNDLYATQSVAGSGLWQVPVLSLVLWVVAIGAIVLGFVLKPVFAASAASAAREVRLAGLAFHLLGLVVGFLLWDLETKVFLGTSLLTLLAGGGSNGIALATIGGIELMTLSFAYLYFGLPARFLVNSFLKLSNLRRARGIGKGLGHITSWGLGAPFYAVLLNPFLSLLVDKLTQAF